MKITEYNIKISRMLQPILNFCLLILAILLLFFLVSKNYPLTLLFNIKLAQSFYYLLEGIITYFLYFAFILLIIKYFQSNYHFPLRNFIYIDIKVIVYLIIIVHESAVDTIIYGEMLLLLLLALYFTNTEKIKLEQ